MAIGEGPERDNCDDLVLGLKNWTYLRRSSHVEPASTLSKRWNVRRIGHLQGAATEFLDPTTEPRCGPGEEPGWRCHLYEARCQDQTTPERPIRLIPRRAFRCRPSTRPPPACLAFLPPHAAEPATPSQKSRSADPRESRRIPVLRRRWSRHAKRIVRHLWGASPAVEGHEDLGTYQPAAGPFMTGASNGTSDT